MHFQRTDVCVCMWIRLLLLYFLLHHKFAAQHIAKAHVELHAIYFESALTLSRIYFRSCAASGGFIFTPAVRRDAVHAAFLAAAALLFICFPVCSAFRCKVATTQHLCCTLTYSAVHFCIRATISNFISCMRYLACIYLELSFSGVP